MADQIETLRVQQYTAGLQFLVQQKTSMLRGAVRIETVNGKSAFFNQIGSATAQLKTSRHQETPAMDTPQARRRVTTAVYHVNSLVSKDDVARMMMDPTSAISQAHAMAMGRAIDDVILTAVDATAYTGETGATSTAFDTNMVVDVQTVWPGVSAADTGFNVAKMIATKEKLGSGDVDPNEEVFIGVNQRQISSLLKDERAINKDYTMLSPLMDGKIARFMGCTLIPTNRIQTDANGDDKLPFWTRSGLLLGIAQDVSVRTTERPDLSYSWQIYTHMDIGATRMEEARVGYIECDPGASPTTDA